MLLLLQQLKFRIVIMVFVLIATFNVPFFTVTTLPHSIRKAWKLFGLFTVNVWPLRSKVKPDAEYSPEYQLSMVVSSVSFMTPSTASGSELASALAFTDRSGSLMPPISGIAPMLVNASAAAVTRLSIFFRSLFINTVLSKRNTMIRKACLHSACLKAAYIHK